MSCRRPITSAPARRGARRISTRQTEIDRLIEAALRLRPKGGLRSRTYATLIALLSVTGLRISEALKLTVADVTRDGLLIRETKFRKTRLVPLHDTAVAGLKRYLARRRPGSDDDPVFVDARGLPLRYIAVKETFDRLVGRAGIVAVGEAPSSSARSAAHVCGACAARQPGGSKPKRRAYGGARDLHGSRQHLRDLLVSGGHCRPHARRRRGR